MKASLTTIIKGKSYQNINKEKIIKVQWQTQMKLV